MDQWIVVLAPDVSSLFASFWALWGWGKVTKVRLDLISFDILLCGRFVNFKMMLFFFLGIPSRLSNWWIG
jgi:hypothetical protein